MDFASWLFSEELSNPQWVMVHGGSGWDIPNKSFAGSGEPGGIRPFGQGLYGYLAMSPTELQEAIKGAVVYARKYGGEKPFLHFFMYIQK